MVYLRVRVKFVSTFWAAARSSQRTIEQAFRVSLPVGRPEPTQRKMIRLARTYVALAAARCAALTVSAAALSLGSPLGSGTFGCVRWGELDGDLVVVKTAKGAEKRAATYLDTEAYINALNRLAAFRAGEESVAFVGAGIMRAFDETEE